MSFSEPLSSVCQLCLQSQLCWPEAAQQNIFVEHLQDAAAERLSRQLGLAPAGGCWPEGQAGKDAAASRTLLPRGCKDCWCLHLQEVDLLKVTLAEVRAQIGRDQQQLRQLERQLSRIRIQQDKLRFQELQVCPPACHSSEGDQVSCPGM